MLKRYSTSQNVALLTTSASPSIDISGFASGEVTIPNGSPITTLTYFIANPAGTFFAAQDAAAAPVTQTVAADKSYPIPAVLFGSGLIQIRVNAAGSVGIILKT